MMEAILYVIGDIHGRYDLLKALLEFIHADARYHKGRPVIYFLGDVVDRGPQSREAMELVFQTLQKYPGSLLHMGNHDLWFMDFVAGYDKDPEHFDDWLGFGGRQTLASYYPGEDPKEACEKIRTNYRHHLRMVEQSRLVTQKGKFVFVHAGVDRSRPPLQQSEKVALMIRDPFLSLKDWTAPVVLHGHTIFPNGPEVTENRISMDVGSYKTNRMAACRIRPSAKEIAFLEAEGMGQMIETRDIEPRLVDRNYGTVFDRIDELFDGNPFSDL